MFGQNQPQPGPLFGQTAAQSGSVFGQTVSQPGSMFGQTASQPGSMFGQTASQPGSVFGQRVSQPASLFGQPQIGSSGFGSQGSSATSISASQNPSFGQSSSFTGPVGGFGQVQKQTTGFGQPSSSAGAGLFGQGSTAPRGFGSSSGSSSSSSLFGQSSSTALGPSPIIRPGPFGQSGGTGFGVNATSSSAGLFGQSAFTAAGSPATTTSSTMFTSASVFGQTSVPSSSTSLFGQPADGPSAFQSPTSSAAFGQPQTSAVSFGTQSLFGQQTSTATAATGHLSGFGQAASTAGAFTSSIVKTTSSSAQPSIFGQPSTASGLFTQGTSATPGFPERTAAFGQPSSTSGTSVVTSSNIFAPGAGRLGPSSTVRPQSAGLFSTGFGHPTPSGSSSSTGSSNFDLTVGSSSFDLLAARSKAETAGSSAASTDVKGTGLFGKKEEQGHLPQQDRKQGLFGKGLSAPLESSSTVVTVKQEPASQRSSLFGKPDSSSEQSSSSRTGLFGRGASSRQTVPTTGSEQPVQPTGRGARHVKQEREVKHEPSSSSGLFGKQAPEGTTQGLFGKPPKKEEPDREKSEERGFRPRLPRVGDEPVAGTSRSLFGRPVTQSTRPARGSDEGIRGRRPSLSRQMSDDNSGKVAIVCRNVPTKYNNHGFLRKHFSRYGYVTKVFPNFSRMQATIHFQTHEQAADAKRRGRLIARGVSPMDIFWSAYTAPVSPSPQQRGQDRGQGHETAARSREDVAGPSRPHTTFRRGDPNINEELESMSGTDDLRGFDRKKSPSPRPEDVGSRGSRSPEKRVRSASPSPSTSADSKTDKVVGLSSFQGIHARTTTERVQLLDQRDKFIRLNRKKKQTDLKRGAFVGTCPDMCPEKERYDREDKRRLSYFEMIPGTENIPGRNPSVDHSRAVKEYIRSSPDQDEPLPHELRPIPVLQMTMTYLLCEVADQGQDGYWGDWFDFFWNRTRGIRKDITQQQLNDRRAVELIEKCARFHIFCSERLCEEDMHSFDAKINNENLTKCLQTLREFYHDLEKKQNVFCQNEAEFRAYTVLMNLNEGDILREVQQLRPEVRTSPAIIFALQVYSAVSNNNYVRFFRLVKQASFNFACIMHRYFTQVRNRALTSMMRTYGMGNKPAQIPISELVRLLGFENDQEASDFCEHYGFMTEDGDVILDRNDYLEPEAAWLPRRSILLIESKRMVSVGEMINGENLPKFEIPTPVSSFDSQGRFKSAVELPGSATLVLDILLGNKGAHIYNGNGMEQCSACKKWFKTAKTLLNHKCSFCCNCDKIFSSYQKFQQHKCTKSVSVVTNKDEEECTDTKVNLSAVQVRQSLLKTNIETLICERCHRSYKTRKTLVNHKCTHCDSCSTTFTTYKNFLSHTCSKAIKTKYQETDKALNKKFRMTSEPVRDMSIVADMVGGCGNFIPDDVICVALDMIRQYTGSDYHGYITPAEMTWFLSNPTEASPPVPDSELSINIHNIGNHWVTSVYNPQIGRILVYDSLRRIEHYTQIVPQLRLLYGSELLSRVDFIPVTQQGADAACGAFAVAYAFCYCLGMSPSLQKFDKLEMRTHLSDCIQSRQIVAFPTTNSNNTCTETDSNNYKRKWQSDPDLKNENSVKKCKKSVEGVEIVTSGQSKKLSPNDSERKQQKRKSAAIREIENFRKRQNSESRRKEAEHKRNIRRAEEVRHWENMKKRQNLDCRKREGEHKHEIRKEEAYRRLENRKKRQNPDGRQKAREHKHEVRKEEAYRSLENRKKRQNPHGRQKEREHKHEVRKEEDYRSLENRKKRQNPDGRQKEREHKHEVRKEEDYRSLENRKKRENLESHGRDKERKHEVRKEENYRSLENRKKRQNPDGRQKEREHKHESRNCKEIRRLENMRKKNIDSRYQAKEHKQLTRECKSHRDSENKKKKERKGNSVSEIVKNFHITVQSGPLYVCTCCSQMMYQESVRLVPKLLNIDENLKRVLITGTKSVDNKEWICHTCFSAIKSKKIPSCAIANLMDFPVKPPELNLTDMEERLVATRIPFMCLHQLPRGGQLSLNGNVVNVPANVTNTILRLPRNMNDSECIPVKLKRKLSFGHHVDFRNIRPQKVISAVNWLVANSKLYQEEGVVVNDAWNPTKNTVEKTDDSPDESTDEPDPWDETAAEEQPVGTLDTLLVPQDLTDEACRIFSFAPAEGNTPVSIFMDHNAEELAFPTLFGGRARPDNMERPVKISYADICKSELRRSDRRMASHIPNLFFKFKKLQTKHILDKANICIRKTQGKQDLTAGHLKSLENVEKLCRLNEGFRIFKDLRGSPPYWEQTKKDIFAMIRKLGIPTWFTSFSSAETRWMHLLQILYKSVHMKTLSDQEVSELTWFQKSELIKSDPVTCARHFDHQVKKFLSDVLQNSYNVIGKVTDYFYKVEFQMRGSPHIHMLVWVEDSPTLDGSEDAEARVIAFVDKYVTCSKDESVDDVVPLQQHSHSRTCQKKNKNECRFNFPMPPMPETCILEPFGPETTAEEKKIHEKNWEKIKKKLDDLKTGKDIDFHEFLKEIDLTMEEYTLAVRSSLKSLKIFLQRQVDEIRINSYNKCLLQCWRANMDIQFVTDPYACAMYIVTYIAKAQRGMSNLLLNAAKEAKEGNQDIRKQVRTIGHKFLTHVEVSAQEAVYFILQLPLKNASRDVMFINTSPENERVVMLKSRKLIQNLPDESTDVETTSIIGRYAQRPRKLYDLCLADFCSNYRVVYNSRSVNTNEESDDINPASDNNCCLTKQYKCEDGTILRKRKRPIVIRYVRYQYEMDSENYFREVLMLFYPWRKEEMIIGDCETYQEKFQQLVDITDIKDKMKEYNHNWYELDEAVKDLEKRTEDSMEDEWDRLAPNAQQVERDDEEEGITESDIFPVFAPLNTEVSSFSEIPGGPAESESDRTEVMVNVMPEEDYLSMVRSLNKQQREIFHHVLYHLKVNASPLYLFLTGGAGVGKTVVVKAIYQAMLRYYNKSITCNPDNIKVLLAAPTGIAAYLIKGNTLHSLFKIPVSQKLTYKPLTSDKLNTLHCKFQDVKLLIIDEISMVGNRMLSFIHHRLQQITGSSKLFGGISVIAVGDLFQLKPVFDGWVFENLTQDYGPLATNLWTENFQIFQLTEIMRQKDSAEFAQLLNRLRESRHTEKDIQMLNTRVINKDVLHPDYPLKIPHIFISNRMVDSHNSLVYETSTNKICIKAMDVVLGDVSKDVKEKVKRSVPQDASKTMGLSSQYKSALGLRNEISCNIDVEDGLANGAGCVLESVGSVTATGKISYLWVKFEDQSVGKKCREENKKLYTSAIHKSWTPVFKVKRQFPVGRYQSVMVMREQIPLRCAAAKTCHRCQGDTMEAAVVDFTGRTFPHSHYVALSRVTSIDNLYIRELNEKSITTSKAVNEEMGRLGSEMLLKSPLLTYHTAKKPCLKLLFHNVRSLHKHFRDILPDENYNCSDVVIFVETKLKPSDVTGDYCIPGFYLFRFDGQCSGTSRSPFGMIVYTKLDIDRSTICHKVKKTSAGTVIEMVTFVIQTEFQDVPQIRIAAVYASPKAKWTELKEFLEEAEQLYQLTVDVPVVLAGDFNVDLLANCSHAILKTIGLKQQITQPTTDNNSLIDHVYTNVMQLQVTCGVLESHFSDHKAVFALFQ